MISLGPAADLVVAALIAVGQLIEPVPEAAVFAAEQKIQERASCSQFQEKKKAYATERCERLKSNRARYRETCQGLENEMNTLESQCATDPTISKILRFRPQPIETVISMNNARLVEELNLICNAVQDRVFLEREQWLAGEVANRDDFAGKLVVLQQPELKTFIGTVIQEAQNPDFKLDDIFKVMMALCHWKVDRKAIAQTVDFSGGQKLLAELVKEIPNVNSLPELQQANFVFDKNNKAIGEIYDSEFITRAGKRYLSRVHRRRLAKPHEIPAQLFNAFMAIEDKRFRDHNGFDFEAVKRLYYGGVQGSKQGGSTFTMQLVKNAFFDDDVELERENGRRTLRRKLKEILMVPMVEKRYSKDEILAYYLNLIDLTPEAQGLVMASIDLFGKPKLKDLTLPEMALLAALPKGISKYNPRRFPDESKLRRDTVIRVMAEQGYISEAEKVAAQAEPLKLVPRASEDIVRVKSRYFNGHLANHFRALKEQNLHDPRWRIGGLDIKTGFDPDLQASLMKALQKGLLQYERNTTDPDTGRMRYRWKPWLSDTTQANLNIGDRVKSMGEDKLPLIMSALAAAHPAPETDWVVAVKTAERGNTWMLEDLKRVAVDRTDYDIHRRLLPWDAVLLEKTETGYRLISPPMVQGAAVMMNVENGEVMALSGGFSAGPYGKFAQNNRATRSVRQPGSTVKPFSYLYALNKGWSPQQRLSNQSVRFPKTKACPFIWAPKNYSNNGSSSYSMRTALETSANRTVLSLFLGLAGLKNPDSGYGTDLEGANPDQVRTLESTLYDMHEFSMKLGVYPRPTDLTKKPTPICFPYLLGGYETTPLNMAEAYTVIANGGLSREAVFMKEVVKEDQPLIIDESLQKWAQVQQYRSALQLGLVHSPEAFGAIPGLSPQSVAQVRSILQGVVERGTASRLKHYASLIGGKTGTTNSNNDAWFVGFSKHVVVAIWIGYDSTRDFSDLGENRTGGGLAVPIFGEIIDAYYKIYPERLMQPLPSPTEIPGIARFRLDPSSGRTYNASSDPDCQRAPGYSIDEYFVVTEGGKGPRRETACRGPAEFQPPFKTTEVSKKTEERL